MRLRPKIEITEEEILGDLLYPAPAPVTERNGEERPEPFMTRMTARWSDVDANGHVRNTAYSDLATEARLAFFAAHGMTVDRLLELGILPVLLAERLTYRREARVGDELSVGVALAALSRDASRGRVSSVIRKGDGRTAAEVVIDGAWLSPKSRELVAPPKELAEILWRAPRAAEFEVLAPSSAR